MASADQLLGLPLAVLKEVLRGDRERRRDLADRLHRARVHLASAPAAKILVDRSLGDRGASGELFLGPTDRVDQLAQGLVQGLRGPFLAHSGQFMPTSDKIASH